MDIILRKVCLHLFVTQFITVLLGFHLKQSFMIYNYTINSNIILYLYIQRYHQIIKTTGTKNCLAFLLKYLEV